MYMCIALWTHHHWVCRFWNGPTTTTTTVTTILASIRSDWHWEPMIQIGQRKRDQKKKKKWRSIFKLFLCQSSLSLSHKMDHFLFVAATVAAAAHFLPRRYLMRVARSAWKLCYTRIWNESHAASGLIFFIIWLYTILYYIILSHADAHISCSLSVSHSNFSKLVCRAATIRAFNLCVYVRACVCLCV